MSAKTVWEVTGWTAIEWEVVAETPKTYRLRVPGTTGQGDTRHKADRYRTSEVAAVRDVIDNLDREIERAKGAESLRKEYQDRLNELVPLL